MQGRLWTSEEVNYLKDNWGQVSMDTIGKNLNRSSTAVQLKAVKLDLGPFLNAGEYVTLNQFMKEIRGRKTDTYTVNQWTNKGLPIRSKKVKDCSFRVIYYEDFWKWAEKNRTLIDFSKLEPLIFGKEPAWLNDQRRADIERTYFKKTPWTEIEENQLKSLLNSYKYTYRDISLKLRRTEGAIKRRICDLKIKARPVKMSNHNPWPEEDVNKLKELYNKGHSHNTMANYINRSAQSCSGKVERLIKEGVLNPRSDFRISC